MTTHNDSKWLNWYLTMHCGFQIEPTNDSQIGGTISTVKYKKDGKFYEFIYETSKYDHIYHYGENGKECIILKIAKENKYKECYIQSISNLGNCRIDDMYYSKKGTFLVRLAINFIVDVLKKKHDLKMITLKDNSYKFCETKNIFLADMYFLLYGSTWYGKYGFRPYDGFGKSDKILLKIYDNNQKIHEKTYVRDVEKKMKAWLHKYNNDTLIDEKIDNLVNENKNMKLSQFLKMFLNKFDKTCGIFNRFIDKLMNEIGMISLAHKSFFVLV